MISMCVLSYNRLDFLKRTLASMIDTATQPFELIVHDDGSTDHLIRRYLSGLVESGVISRVILNPPGHNEGQGVALNRMFNMASGDLIVKCDQDLIFRPGWMEAIDRAFVSNCKLREGDEPAPIGAPLIGTLGLFHYHHPPVAAHDMLITARAGYEEVQDYCGSLIVVPRLTWREFGPWEERSPSFDEDHVFKMKITDAHGWCNALTTEDYVENIGFGVGPSTVVVAEGEIQSIKDGPKLVRKGG